MTTEIDVKQGPEQHTESTERTRGGQVYRPHVDIYEQGDDLVLVADLPGVQSDAIDLQFEDGTLTIQGKVEPRFREDLNFLWCEYGIGDFYRTFRVSEQIDASRIQAEYGNGVLMLHLPKAEAAKARKIQVLAAH